MKKALFLTICLTTFLTVIGSCAWGAGYDIRDLFPTTPASVSEAVVVNNMGQVLCQKWAENSSLGWGYIWSEGHGSVQLAGTPTRDRFLAMNNSGLVVGARTMPNYTIHASLWAPGLPVRDLGAYPGTTNSYAHALNDLGQVVGWSDGHMVLWDSAGSMTSIYHSADWMATPTAINNSGKVVWDRHSRNTGDAQGGRAFVWDAVNGSVELPLLAGTEWSWAYGINEAGQVVGFSGNHAVLWQTDGSIVDLGFSSNFGKAVAYDINNLGQIVGELDGRSVIWNGDGTVEYLPNMWSSDGKSTARSINDAGYIAGRAWLNNEVFHAVLWQPVPEPAGILALLVGVGGLLLRRKL